MSTFSENEVLEMETYTERPSFEKLQCERISGDQKIEFLIELKKLKNVVSLFQASNVDSYFTQRRCTIYSKAEILIEKEKEEIIKKPFIAVALLNLARKE